MPYSFCVSYGQIFDYLAEEVYLSGDSFAETATAGMFGKGSEEHGQTIPAVGVLY